MMRTSTERLHPNTLMFIKVSKIQGQSSRPAKAGTILMGKMTDKELAKISKALADPTRLRIYQAISSCEEMACGEVMKKCPLAPGTVSHHLKILAEADLIEPRREGQFIYNRSRPETIREYTRALNKIAREMKPRAKF
jgi:ArsR family transcriptional regulator